MRRLSKLSTISRFFVSNVSEKKYVYSFEAGVDKRQHPLRNLSGGTDKLIVTPHLLAIADDDLRNQKYHQEQNDDKLFSKKLLKCISNFYQHQFEQNSKQPIKLINSAMQLNNEEGRCTLTLALLNPDTGQISFYYIGDSLYGIVQKKTITMVQGLYESFNESMKLGKNDYSPESGFVQKYLYKDIKDDFIVLASNGLWNNLHLNAIHYFTRGLEESKQENFDTSQLSVQKIAEKLGKAAEYYSRKGQYESPYYSNAKKIGIQVPKQGILDDITIIVARIRRQIAIK